MYIAELVNDRLEGRKLAKEWQKFGRYSADVVKKEVPQYREKVKQLESLQECILDSLGIVLDMYTSSTFEIVPQQSTQVADGRRASFDMNTSVSSSETSNRGYWQPESAYSERSASDASQISQNSCTVFRILYLTVALFIDGSLLKFTKVRYHLL